MAESFVSTLKVELMSRLELPSRRVAKSAIFDYLQSFYNTHLLYSAPSYMSLADFEEDRTGEVSAA